MDGRINLSELYIVDCNNNTSNEGNEENFDETINCIKGWGENGVGTKLVNITTTTNDTTTTRIDVDG
jgi:hypothetical protein